MFRKSQSEGSLTMSESLYNKYGGFASVSKLVQEFYRRVLEEDSLKNFFEGVSMERLMDHQTHFLCKAMGGPDNYEGRSLAPAHVNLGISSEDFGLVGEILQETLEDGGVEDADVAAIMGIVVSVKDQIVTK